MSIKVKRIPLVLGGIFLTLSLIIAGGWIARVAVLQTLSEYAFRSQGIEESSLKIKTFDLQALVIEDLRFGSVINADNVTVTYEFLKLLEGSVDTITINELFVDISDPSSRIYTQIRALADGGNDTPDSAALKFPTVFVNNFKISENRIERSAVLEGNASLSSSGNVELQSHASLRLKTPNGDISLNNASIHAEGSIHANSFKVALKDAVLQQDGDAPQFSAVQIMAEGEIVGTKASGAVNLRSVDGIELIDLKGQFDIEKQSGLASYKIDQLIFDKEGLQPDHLAPVLSNLPLVSGTLSGQGKAIIQGDVVNLVTNTILEDVSVAEAPYRLLVPKIENKSTLQMSTAVPISKLESVTKIAALTAKVDNENFGVRHFVSSVTGKDQNALTATFEGIVESAQKKKSFPELAFIATAKKSMDDIALNGTIEGFSKKLNIKLKADHNIASEQGSANFAFAAFKIGENGTKLADISAFLSDISGEITAEVSSVINAKWRGDFNPIVKISTQVKNAAFREKTLEITEAGAEIETSEFTLNDPLTVQINNLSSVITAEGRKFAVSAANSNLTLGKNYSHAEMSVPVVILKPKEGAVLKPDIQLAVQGATDFKELRMNIRASSQLLGQFVVMDGTYNIPQKRGAMAIETVKIPFDPEGLTLADLLQEPPEDITLSGSVAAKLDLEIEDGLVDGRGTIDIDSLSIDQDGTSLNALNGELELTGLIPLRTAPMQRLQADSIDAGIRIGNPILDFSVEQVNDKPILKIHRMIMNLFGGAAEIKDEVIDPFAKSNRLKVHLTSLSIEELVALGDLEEVVASGSLRGIIPLEFDGEKLIIPDAVLEAEGPGVLSVKSQAARQALASGGSQTKLLFDILENFNYSALSLKIKKPETGEDIVSLHTKGANPNVENNRPVVLNVNLSTNLDRIFNTILDGYRLSEKALRATLKGRK